MISFLLTALLPFAQADVPKLKCSGEDVQAIRVAVADDEIQRGAEYRAEVLELLKGAVDCNRFRGVDGLMVEISDGVNRYAVLSKDAIVMIMKDGP